MGVPFLGLGVREAGNRRPADVGLLELVSKQAFPFKEGHKDSLLALHAARPPPQNDSSEQLRCDASFHFIARARRQ